MGFFKNAIIGVAIYQAWRYLTKKDELGRSKIDEIKEKTPEWVEKAKSIRDNATSKRTFEEY